MISQSHFLYNRAIYNYSQGGGNNGAIAIFGKVYASITYCLFEYNSAVSGGAIAVGGSHWRGQYFTAANLTISFCKFIGNSITECYLSRSIGYGGAVLDVAVIANVSITHSYFINNSALGVNGGVLQLKNNARMSIVDSIFEGNHADNGGSIYLTGAKLTISNSSFNGNSADKKGVLYIKQSSVLCIDGTMFNKNKAKKDGGIIYTVGASLTMVNNSNITDNLAGNDGGALASRDGSITVFSSIFCNNSAANDGGVFQIFQGTLNLSNNVYSTNRAKDGGVIYEFESNTTIVKCSFHNNCAMNDGGAINANQEHLSISKDTTFEDNRALNDGGAIFAFELRTVVTESSYNYNNALNRGGVWHIYQGSLTITATIVSHSEADQGGVIYADQGNIIIKNISCLRNKVKGNGGVLWTEYVTVHVNHSSFSQNYATELGGAWFMEDSKVILQDVSLNRNSAYSGGAVYASNGHMFFSDITMEGNVANFEGASMHISTATLNSFNSLLISSNQGRIGAAYLLGSRAHFSGQITYSNNFGTWYIIKSNVTFIGTTTFTSSEPGRFQDALELEGGALTVFMSQLIMNGTNIFIKNYAENGGAIHVKESNVLVIGETIIANNTARKTAGGVYLEMSKFFCTGTSILKLKGNRAIEKGGGMHAISSTININDKFDDETSVEAIYSGSQITIEGNQAKKGGGLYLSVNAKVNVFKYMSYYKPFPIVTFMSNVASQGGAIYVSDQDICSHHYIPEYKDCFFQILAVYGYMPLNRTKKISNKNLFFYENLALMSG